MVTRDPILNINLSFLSKDQNNGTVLVTYYLSRLRYFIDVDMTQFINDENFIPIAGPGMLFMADRELTYDENKDDVEIDATIVIFHALFGAYAFCRGTWRIFTLFFSYTLTRYK